MRAPDCTVWKFPLLSTGPMEIDVPRPGEIVHVDRDPATGMLAFWAIVRPTGEKQARRFEIIRTGGEVKEDARHLGTVIVKTLVWHLFELSKEDRA